MSSKTDVSPVMVVHGGAGVHSTVLLDHFTKEEIHEGVKSSAKAGYSKLLSGGSAVDAVEAAVMYMEEEHIFNAGEQLFLGLRLGFRSVMSLCECVSESVTQNCKL